MTKLPNWYSDIKDSNLRKLCILRRIFSGMSGGQYHTDIKAWVSHLFHDRADLRKKKAILFKGEMIALNHIYSKIHKYIKENRLEESYKGNLITPQALRNYSEGDINMYPHISISPPPTKKEIEDKCI